MIRTKRSAGVVCALSAMLVSSLAHADPPIEVGNVAQLLAALASLNNGGVVRLLPGDYELSAPLFIPDRVRLHGSGVMTFSEDDTPVGFRAGTESRLLAASDFVGRELVRLGDESMLSGVAVLGSLPGGYNTVGVHPGVSGHLSAAIRECEVRGPGGSAALPGIGPLARGVYVWTRPGSSGDTVSLDIERSVLDGGGRVAVFPINHGSSGLIQLTLHGNLFRGLGGTLLDAVGGASPFRTQVTDATLEIDSDHNVFMGGATAISLTGAADGPPLSDLGALRNSLLLYSNHDRVIGSDRALFGGAALRREPSSTQSSFNTLYMDLHHFEVDPLFSGFEICVTDTSNGLGDESVGEHNAIVIEAHHVVVNGDPVVNFYEIACGEQQGDTSNTLDVFGAMPGYSP